MLLDSISRRCLTIVATTVSCLVVADLWVRHSEATFRNYDTAVYDKTVNEVTARGVPEIVLLGSSRAKYALMPAEFEAVTGRQAYNLAVAGSKVVEWQLLSKRVFEGQRPSLVVLGVNASEFRADYIPADAARQLFTLGDLWEHLTRDRPSMEVLGAYARHKLGPLWAAFDRRYEIKMWGAEQIAGILPKHAQESRELRERLAKARPSDGFDHPWLNHRQLQTLEDKIISDETHVVRASVPLFSPAADAFRRFGDLLDWFRDQHIALLVVYIPNSPETENRWNGVEPAMITAIADVCRGHGVPFLPCGQQDLPRTNGDFVEEVHVGLPFARRFSQRTAWHLLALNLVPAPRVREVLQDGERSPSSPPGDQHRVDAEITPEISCAQGKMGA